MLGLLIGAIAFVAGMSIGAVGMQKWDAADRLEEQQQLAAAEMELDARADKLKQQTAEADLAKKVAYDKGKADAKAVQTRANTRTNEYVANNPGFANPQCNIGDDLVHLINVTSAAFSDPTSARIPDAAVRATGTVSGRADGNSSPANGTGQSGGRAVGNVLPGQVNTGGAGQVPRTSTGRVPPKPVPIK